jgi:DNA-directed RNA polymerase specialized sigma24 family protein
MNNHLIYDSQLLEALRVNDTTAFEKLFDRYWFVLFQYANNKLNSEEEAKEIVRDIFIDLWEHRSSISPGFSFIVYLYIGLRKRVAGSLHRQICEKRLEYHRKNLLLSEFSVQRLKSAYRPVSLRTKMVNTHEEVPEDFRYPLLYMFKKLFQYGRNYCLRILFHDIPARFSKTFL